MRNLKRVLSLALALVMVLGMMVMTTSAAFTDAEEITYTEAVDVMSALGVINGYEAADGTYYFDADKALTRAEGAALVCYILMGKTNADKLIGSGNFSDVPADHWAAGEIDYCYNLGYITGNGDGTFSPAGPLTSIGFGRMLLGALNIKGEYTGANWATNIAAAMIDAGLDIAGVAMDAQLTREQAAQMAFQALFVSEAAEKVTVYKINVTTDANDSMAAVKAASYASFTEAYLLAKEAEDAGSDVWTIAPVTNVVYTDSLADKLFGLSYGDATDDFMRPATAYASTMPAYNAVNYVLAVDEADLVVEGKILSKVLYNKVGYKAAGYAWTNYVDGAYSSTTAPSATGVSAFGSTDDGTVMYVYIDHAAQTVTTSLVNTYIGQVKKVTEAKNGVPRYVTLTDGKTFVTNEFAAKDIVLYTYSSKQVGTTPADAGVQSMAKAELVSGKLEKITSDGTYTVDGVDYVVSAQGATAIGAGNLGKPVSFYVDGYKNMMLDKGAAVASAQYIYVLANSAVKSTTDYQTGITKSLEVYGVDTAGNVVTHTVSKIGGSPVASETANSLAGLYSYTVNAINGTYELTAATSPAATADIAVNATTVAYNSTTAILNSDTTFVFVKQAKKALGDLTVTEVTVKEGNANIGTAIDVSETPAYVVAANGVAKVIFVDRGFTAAVSATTNVTYIQHNVRNTTQTVSTVAGPVTTYFYANSWNVDGKLTIANKASVGATGLYKMNDDGSVGALVSTSSGIITAINGNVITVNGSTYLNVTDKTVEIYTGEAVELIVGQTIAYKTNTTVATNLDYLVVTEDIVEVADDAELAAALAAAAPYETIYLTGTTYAAVTMPASATNVAIVGNGATVAGITGTGSHAIANLTLDNIVFTGNVWYGGYGGTISNLTVTDCVFNNAVMAFGNTVAMEKVTVTGCTFMGGVVGKNAITVNNVKDAYIANNTIEADDIAVHLQGTTTGYVEIVDNNIKGTGDRALRVQDVAATGKVVYKNNRIANCAVANTVNEGVFKVNNTAAGSSIVFDGNKYDGAAWNPDDITGAGGAVVYYGNGTTSPTP